jgi:hypothetical protein
MKNISNLFFDFGDVVGIIAGAIIMILDIVEKGISINLLTKETGFQVGLVLFLLSCLWMVLKAKKSARESQEKLEKAKVKSPSSNEVNVTSHKQSGGITANTVNISLPDVKKKKI